MPSEIKQITSAEQIIAASELLDRINEQIEERGFLPAGGAPYIPRHFTTSLHDDLIHNSRAVAWLSDNAFLWAEVSELPHNRRHRIAVEKMFLTDWRRSQQDGMSMLLHFQDWADKNGCSMAYVTIQPAHDPRKQKYMERLGFKPYETVYAWQPGKMPEQQETPTRAGRAKCEHPGCDASASYITKKTGIFLCLKHGHQHGELRCDPVGTGESPEPPADEEGTQRKRKPYPYSLEG